MVFHVYENEDQPIINLPNMSFDDFSDDVLNLILSKLSPKTLSIISCTSKRFHKLCWNPQFFSTIVLDDSYAYYTPFSIAALCGRGPDMRHLTINLHRNDLPDSIFFYLACSCTHLTSLSINLCTTKGKNINEFSIDLLLNFLSSSKVIRSLTFKDSALLDDAQFERILPYILMIQSINLSGCSISDVSLFNLSQQCSSLQVLDISETNISGVCLSYLFHYCSGLKIFRANNCLEIQHNVFDTIPSNHFKSITELSIINTPINLENSLTHFINLNTLKIGTLDDSTLIPFLMQNKSIEVLYVGKETNVTISSLLVAIQTCGNKLKSLMFNPFFKKIIINDEIIRLICYKCKNLKTLSLSCCYKISTYWVIKLLKKLKFIEDLSFYDWENANSSTLKIISEYMKNLKFFRISGSNHLTTKGVIEFIELNKNIHNFEIKGTSVNTGLDGSLDPVIISNLQLQNNKIIEISPGVITYIYRN